MKSYSTTAVIVRINEGKHPIRMLNHSGRLEREQKSLKYKP